MTKETQPWLYGTTGKDRLTSLRTENQDGEMKMIDEPDQPAYPEDRRCAMIYRFLIGCIVVLFILAFPGAAAQSRVVTRNAATGIVQKGRWVTMSEAINAGMIAGVSETVSACWIEEKRKLFLFIPLPSRHIPISTTRRTPVVPTAKQEHLRSPD